MLDLLANLQMSLEISQVDGNTVEQALSGSFPEVFRALDITGVFLNGILGGKLARQKRFDLVGFAVLAVMSGLGGGIIRDLMLNNAPPVALTDKYYLVMAFAGAFVAWLWKLDGKWSRRALIFCDAMVLGVWAATGTQKALGLGFAVIPAILMGVVTAIGGGMVRDISAGNVPVVFGGNPIYAIPAVAASAVDALLFTLGFPLLGMLIATLLGSSLTILASWRRWVLPDLSEWSISMTPRQWRAFQSGRGAKLEKNPPETQGSTEERGLEDSLEDNPQDVSEDEEGE